MLEGVRLYCAINDFCRVHAADVGILVDTTRKTDDRDPVDHDHGLRWARHFMCIGEH